MMIYKLHLPVEERQQAEVTWKVQKHFKQENDCVSLRYVAFKHANMTRVD